MKSGFLESLSLKPDVMSFMKLCVMNTPWYGFRNSKKEFIRHYNTISSSNKIILRVFHLLLTVLLIFNGSIKVLKNLSMKCSGYSKQVTNFFLYSVSIALGWRYINTIPFTRENSLIPLERIFNDPPSLFSIKSHEYERVNF